MYIGHKFICFLSNNRKTINHPDIWGPPGGHCEINELPLNCAKRELEEETGYKIKKLFYHSAANYPLKKQKPPSKILVAVTQKQLSYKLNSLTMLWSLN